MPKNKLNNKLKSYKIQNASNQKATRRAQNKQTNKKKTNQQREKKNTGLNTQEHFNSQITVVHRKSVGRRPRQEVESKTWHTRI